MILYTIYRQNHNLAYVIREYNSRESHDNMSHLLMTFQLLTVES